MSNQNSKPIITRKEKPVLARPQKKSDRLSPVSLKEVFELDILEKNTWGQFLLFIEDCYKDFTPRHQEENQTRANTIQLGIELLEQHNQESWGDILSKAPQKERVEIDEFYQHISRSRKLTAQEVYQESKSAIALLINNAEYGFLVSENRDIGRISQLCDAINYFKSNQSKTYFIISQLPAYVPDNAKPMFAASKRFQEIIAAGPTWKLKNFAMALMQHFRVTRMAITDEAASNLVLSMGEIERDLRTKISRLEQDKLELEAKLKQISSTAQENAMVKIAHELQNGRQPALDQIQQMINILKFQIEEHGEPEISSEQALSIYITLSNLMKILQELGIEAYPKVVKSVFFISQAELKKYSYTEGTPFSQTGDLKQVECIQQGWQVGESVITPAKLRELKVSSEL